MIARVCESTGKASASFSCSSANSATANALGGDASHPRENASADRRRPLKLLVVDDHPVVRKGITSYLSRLQHLQVVGEAADGHEALRQARQLIPDIIVMDIDMPRMNGLTAAEILHREQPRVKVLVLSTFSSPEYVLRIIQSGASGYVLKGTSPEDLAKAIDTLGSGETFFSAEVARIALNQFVRGHTGDDSLHDLTAREREVLIAVAEGSSNKEIAVRLGVGVRTVETHRERIMRKLNIHTVAGLTKYALGKGLVAVERGNGAAA